MLRAVGSNSVEADRNLRRRQTESVMTELSDTRRLILPRSCTRVGNLALPLPKGLRGRGGKYIGREADQDRACVSSTLCSTPVPMLTHSPVVFSISADNSAAMIAATRAG